MPESNDIALLRQYVDEGSEEAFATLVSRHLSKVYSVALRFTRNPAQAEEITQAVFIIFAQRAGKLGDQVIISGWLYQTARLTATTFIRSEVRRTHREQEAFMRNVLENSDTDMSSQISPFLDAAMAGLNDAERNAVVLRFFDGKSIRDVGEELGVNEDAAKKRIHRAVDKLRRFFVKRNLTVSAMSVEAAISANFGHAAPAGLAGSVSAAALAKGVAAGGSTMALIEGTLKGMAWAKLKTSVAIGAVILTAAIAVPMTIQQFLQTPTGKIAYSATSFIKKLHSSGQLPGIVSNAAVAIEVPFFTYDPTNHAGYITTNMTTYPLLLDMTVHANEINDRYHYTIRKVSVAAPWELLKAWLSDTNMTVLKEYPVPHQLTNGP